MGPRPRYIDVGVPFDTLEAVALLPGTAVGDGRLRHLHHQMRPQAPILRRRRCPPTQHPAELVAPPRHVEVRREVLRLHDETDGWFGSRE